MERKNPSSIYLKDFLAEVEDFGTFLATFDHLPKNINNVLLLRFLRTCKFNREKAKRLLEKNLQFRQKYSDLFSERDMYHSTLQRANKTYQINQISKFTKDNLQVTVARLADPELKNFDLIHSTQWFFLSNDANLSSDLHGIADGEIAIIDFNGFSWAHLMKVVANFGAIKAFLKYIQGTVPYYVVQCHFINCSFVVTKLVSLVRPFIRKDMLKILHFHNDSYESLYEFVPRELLPTEYGGTLGTLDEIYEGYLKETYEMSDYVKHANDWILLE